MNQPYTINSPHQIVEQSGYQLGQQFEQYIIRLFNEQFFYLKQWRKAGHFDNGSPGLDYSNPDIEMELIFTCKRKYRFAVECKWRKRFQDGKINWAKDHQICAYRMFQDRARIPVFVAIGIGGEPDNPEKLFLTPLNNIHMHRELYEKDLIEFKRKPTHRFYYDAEQLKLF